MNKLKHLFLTLLLVSSSPLFCQFPAAVFTINDKQNVEILFINDSEKLVYYSSNEGQFVSLYNTKNQIVDSLKLDDHKLEDKPNILIYPLRKDRYFLSTPNYSYNLRINDSRLKLEDKRPIPQGPAGSVKNMYFFDGNKEVKVFLNEVEQYNIYIDSAGKTLEKKETFNTPHLGNINTFIKRPENTPEFIYSPETQELFFHLPTDISFLSVDLKRNSIDIGLIYMEYKQPYTFRRYFDQITSKRYVVKQNDSKNEFFNVSSFEVITFTDDYRSDVLKSPISFVPSQIVNGKLLLKKETNRNNISQTSFFLVPLNQAKKSP